MKNIVASFSGQGVNFGLPLLSFVKSHWFTKSRDRFKFCTPSKFCYKIVNTPLQLHVIVCTLQGSINSSYSYSQDTVFVGLYIAGCPRRYKTVIGPSIAYISYTNNRKRLSVPRKCAPYMGALTAAGWLRVVCA